ncbi:MAG: 30S ribosomal protein S17 [candidate division WOR-3 bacterium]
MRKQRIGTVISDKMNKTRVVLVERLKMHPKYKKYIKARKKFYAHDENNETRIGDVVLIEETRPLSKLKRWIIKKVIKKGEIRNDSGLYMGESN